MLTLFRVITILEGISYILLLFVAMPIKYLTQNDSYVKMLGMPHGVLFIAYIVLAILLFKPQKWNYKDLAIILIASLLPFATFYVDWKYLKKR